ncbi:hypothetical protein [Empedobacter sedimenti]|uniref:hypothetical protein n=1 Tax=Empedobacter sedimenti TaxID=3042610 RepID=UPI0024A6F00B|nr:hypothetical protein [Empedobacter sedimenti]
MCKYAMIPYKDHFACFYCQKTFKRRLWHDIKLGTKEDSLAKCPQCAGEMANMGKDFESPKMNDDKAWLHLKNLYEVGINFFSCGCTGPGYVPRDHEALLKHFENIRKHYFTELEFWRNRIEPETKQERIKDEQRNWGKLSPINSNYKKVVVKNQEGFDYCFLFRNCFGWLRVAQNGIS